jgi:D-alanyl-lipoteichoic acid acyltransferase DltB (MBOAT superfamily)
MIGLTNYTFCIVYFAHLIAGPIVQIQDLRSQLEVGIKKLWSFEKIWIGIIYIVVGLSKKILIADSLAPLANHVFDSVPNPNAWEAAAGSLAYTFQLYFDFSGYCDIATGSSWIIGLELPSNFLSPYKATSIRDFWRRWHVTLGNFLREHIYIPLGGNKKGMAVQLLALFATFFIGGIWHGAGRTFIIWGSLHGVYTCAQTLYEKSPLPRINVLLSGILTFLAVHCAWIFFRASSIQDAKKFFHAFDSWELTLPKGLWGRLPSSIKSISQGTDFLPQIKQQLPDLMPVLLLAMLLTWLAPNSHEIAKKLKPNILSFIALLFFAFWSVMEIGNQNVFLYFKF